MESARQACYICVSVITRLVLLCCLQLVEVNTFQLSILFASSDDCPSPITVITISNISLGNTESTEHEGARKKPFGVRRFFLSHYYHYYYLELRAVKISIEEVCKK